MALVNSSRYWKDNIRIFKVKRDEETGVQIVVKIKIGVRLKDAINSSYTQDDISIIIAINAMKILVYAKAKENPVSPPELFGCVLGDHFMENTLIQVVQK
ncbi:Uricase [Golovinomyces cichoracearum]|uniref:factor independent urate hydroxylase n=1 Tax=Golovinomyces cichoracearum TaxID=62708 RepID=A0A420IYB7_9PEZI|nr:Uricase [Golovinomyces cichoracearum]